ncbi:hypothetical protein COHA_003139 [Chlorella ohadii]|uniref:Sec16 Sec23-binding domain-containing protein n=1 Tax=Chlorella ohadii TaxID=2649997 RepID=A0AAD5DVK3_9CHLO|nr:hypothetical protein COHA_003139 [Chlorella ohadii]
MQPASPPQAQPDSEAGGAAGGAEAEAAADAQQSPQLAEVEDAGPPLAAEEEAWPEQPVTSFQVAARPLFGSTQDEDAFAVGGLGSPAQPAAAQPSFGYSLPSSYEPGAADAAAWPAELPAAGDSSDFGAVPAPWEAQPQQAEWAQQPAPWDDAASSQQPAPWEDAASSQQPAAWEQPQEQQAGTAWEQQQQQQWTGAQQQEQWLQPQPEQQVEQQQPTEWGAAEQPVPPAQQQPTPWGVEEKPQPPPEQQPSQTQWEGQEQAALSAWEQQQQGWQQPPPVPGYEQKSSWEQPAEQPDAWQQPQQPEDATESAAPWDAPEQVQPWQLPQPQPWQPPPDASKAAAVEQEAAASAPAPEAEALPQPATADAYGQQTGVGGDQQAAVLDDSSSAPEEAEAEPAAATSWQPAAAMQLGLAAATPFQASDSTGWDLPSPAAAPAQPLAADPAAGGMGSWGAPAAAAPPQPFRAVQQDFQPAAAAPSAPQAAAPQPWQQAAEPQLRQPQQQQQQQQPHFAADEPSQQLQPQPSQQAQREPDVLDLDSPEVLAAAQASSGSFTSGFQAAPQEDPHAFDFLEEIRSPTAADEVAAAAQQQAPAAATVVAAAAAEPAPAEPAVTAAAEPTSAAEPPAEPATWYDESGYCWCDMPDGWRYWWDATTQQWQQHSETPAGHLQLHALQRGPPEVLQPLPGAPTTSLSSLLQTLDSFPGPLGSNSKSDKVAAFCGEQADAAGADPAADYASSEGRRTLWCVLRVLAAHQGRASSAPYSLLPAAGSGSGKPADPAAAPEAQLAAALLEGVPPVSEPQLLLPAAAPPPEAAAAVAAQVQQLLLEGRRSEALKAAADGQLWGIALLLSRLLGEAAVAGTAAAMAQQCIAQAAPLQTLLLLLGAPAVAPRPGSSNDPTAWRRQLAVMVANRTPGDEAAMLSLGRQLLSAGQLLPAHVAFALAGALLQPWDAAAAGGPSSAGAAAPAEGGKPAPPAPPLVLLGSEAAAQPRMCAQLSAILATEVYTWSRTVGNTALSAQYLPVVPYKLLHAYTLAELGLVQQAAAYCQSMERTLQALGNKVPPGLLVCRAVAADLRDRLQQYAAGQKLSLGSNFTAGALVSSVGKWLDRGLTAMMGGGDASAGTSGGRHSRNPSTSSIDASKHLYVQEAMHKRTASSGSLMGGSAPAADGGSGGGGGGIFHRVSSIKNMLTGQSSKAKLDAAPAAAAAAAPQQPGSPENVFYYDHELKCWRERGAEPPKPEQVCSGGSGPDGGLLH